MTADAPAPAPSRESFFALYWDHARELPCLSVCLLAGIEAAETPRVASANWDDLWECEREKLRAAILELIEIHGYNRGARAAQPSQPNQTNVSAQEGQKC